MSFSTFPEQYRHRFFRRTATKVVLVEVPAMTSDPRERTAQVYRRPSQHACSLARQFDSGHKEFVLYSHAREVYPAIAHAEQFLKASLVLRRFVECVGSDPPLALGIELPDVAYKLHYADSSMRRWASELEQLFQVLLKCVHFAPALEYTRRVRNRIAVVISRFHSLTPGREMLLSQHR